MLAVRPLQTLPSDWRRARLRGLVEPQEFYLERLVSRGAAFAVENGGVRIGHVALNGDMIVEIHLDEAGLALTRSALEALVLRGARRLLVQSFDPMFDVLAAVIGSTPFARGQLYREIVDQDFVRRADVVESPAVSDDIAELAVLSNDFFDSAAEIAAFVDANALTVFRNEAGGVLGAGLSSVVIPGIPVVDIGMVVTPAFRGRGYGAYIVRSLKAKCLLRGERPICGCDIDNFASRRTLQRAGFVSRHELVEFVL